MNLNISPKDIESGLEEILPALIKRHLPRVKPRLNPKDQKWRK